jgi:flagellar basal body-associated protein FliL
MSKDEANSKDTQKPRSPIIILAIRLGMFAAVAIGGAGGGAVAQRALSPSGPAEAQADGDVADAADASEAPSPLKESLEETVEDVDYFEFEPVVVNINDGRLARFIRMAITLAIRQENYLEVTQRIERFQPKLEDKLTVYLSGCTIDEVRGPKNLNRIRREILDMFNDILWPDEASKIEEVLFKEFKIQ